MQAPLKSTNGKYRNDQLASVNDENCQKRDRIRKVIIALFEEKGPSILSLSKIQQ